jgi:hypothetical protein
MSLNHERTKKGKALLRVKLEIIRMREYCRMNGITQQDIEDAAGYQLNVSKIFTLKNKDINAGTLFMIADIIGFEIELKPPTN